MRALLARADAQSGTVHVSIARRWVGGEQRDWALLSIVCALAVTIAEGVLLERKFVLFSGGFLAETHLATWSQRAVFFAASFIADVACVAALAFVALAMTHYTRLAHAARLFIAAFIALTPVVGSDILTYELAARLGSGFDFGLMFGLVGGRVSEVLAVSWAHLVRPALVLGAVVGGAALCTWTLHHYLPFSRSSAVARRGLGPWYLPVLILVLGAVVTSVVWYSSTDLAAGLRRKPSARALATVMNELSDVDRDGFGVLTTPTDSAAFDAGIHPYAIDVPGNGTDENGLAGDLPAQKTASIETRPTAGPWTWRPDTVVILLESVRADAVGSVVNGKPVTPVLDKLARSGASASLAFSHNGFTYQSRYHLFTGRLTSAAQGGTSLIDDFKTNGYQVGYFSGQDDSFGGPALSVGFERADMFYDARREPERRYTQFSTPGSLAVPANVVTEKALQFVQDADRNRPLFVYVNFHDTHFPYHHAGIEPLVSSTVIDQSAIARERAADLRVMYLNTVANVDRAIGNVLREVERVRGRAPAVIVTSDHGESLFDQGFLGHGYSLNDAQTRVPFIAANIPITLSEPFGHADVRQAVQDALTRVDRTDTQPRFSESPTRSTFQYLGSIERPRQIGVVTQQGRTIYDFRTGRIDLPAADGQEPNALSLASSTAFLDLAHRWEDLMWRHNQSRREARQ